MTIEEKAKAYDKAFEIIKAYYNRTQFSSISDSREEIKTIEKAFPELKESENLRIIKAIKYGLNHVFTNNTTVFEVTKEQCLAWLEKQGEHANFCNNIQIGDKVTRNRDGVLVNLSQLNRIAKKDEKQGEQKPEGKTALEAAQEEKVDNQNCVKPADKVEPKFKVGDVVTNKKSKDIVKIVQILHDSYCYSGWDGAATVHSDFSISEQDDYELVEQKPAWSEEDEKMRAAIIFTLAGFIGNEDKIDWLKSLKDRVQPKKEWKQENTEDLTDFENTMMHIGCPFFGDNAGLDPNDTNAIKEQANILLGLVPKQEWSEEDEKYYNSALWHIKNSISNGKPDTITECDVLNWFKSLRPHNRWKPSDKQMEALWNVYQGGEEQATLASLYSDLKRLKRE